MLSNRGEIDITTLSRLTASLKTSSFAGDEVARWDDNNSALAVHSASRSWEIREFRFFLFFFCREKERARLLFFSFPLSLFLLWIKKSATRLGRKKRDKQARLRELWWMTELYRVNCARVRAAQDNLVCLRVEVASQDESHQPLIYLSKVEIRGVACKDERFIGQWGLEGNIPGFSILFLSVLPAVRMVDSGRAHWRKTSMKIEIR